MATILDVGSSRRVAINHCEVCQNGYQLRAPVSCFKMEEKVSFNAHFSAAVSLLIRPFLLPNGRSSA